MVTPFLNASKHFRLEELAEGVYAAISKDGAGAMSNGGIIDLGDRTIIFDAFMTEQAARDLRTAAEQLTNSPVEVLINSHWHADHVRGNQVFADATIISTTKTRDLIAAHMPQRIEQQKKGGGDYLTTLRKQVEEEQDEQKKQSLQLHLSSIEEIEISLATIELTLPTQTFEVKMGFQGSKRSAELITWGGGHSPSDAFLYLPDDGIVFMGDLLFNSTHLALWEANPTEWIEILEKVDTLAVHTTVPGHGTVGTAADLAVNRRYLTHILQVVDEALEQGLSEDEAAALPMPVEYAGLTVGTLYAGNIRAVYKQKKVE